MFDKFHDECGVFAIYGNPEAAKLSHLGLFALQHRGQESAGIAASDGREIRCIKSMGHVAEIFTPPVLKELPGDLAIGHTRYSTAGDTVLLNAQPFSVACNKGRIAVAHNGNITNAAELRADLEREGSIFQASSDTEVILHLVARSRERTLAGALREAMLQLEGAFSLVFLASGPHHCGARSAWVPSAGDGADGTAGRSGVLRVRVGDLRVRSDRRGVSERCRAGRDGDRRTGRASRASATRRCAIWRNASSSTSTFRGPTRSCSGVPCRSRARCWAGCWRANVPPRRIWWSRCPIPGVSAAIGYSAESGLPFRQALIRNHYVGRTFIEPSQAIRDLSVRMKLNPVRYLLEGKSVVLVDDSIVRGTTSRKIVRMVRQAGAREVHLRISCPPTISPCFYGVDTPIKSELIAANHTVEEIRKFVEADSLGYLSQGSLRQAVSDTNHEFCYACYTGNYPTELVNIEELMTAKTRRS